jgi:hypothetical protein
MVLPNTTTETCLLSPNSSSSSSSNNSSSAIESDIDPEYISRILKKPLKKTKRKQKSKSSTKPLNLTKEYATDGNSLLDHLVSHASGDAYTSSALNSPHISPTIFTNPNSEHLNTPVHTSPVYSTIPTSKPVNVEEPTAEPIVSEPPPSDPIPSDAPSTSEQFPLTSQEPDIETLNPLLIFLKSIMVQFSIPLFPLRYIYQFMRTFSKKGLMLMMILFLPTSAKSKSLT